MFGWLAAAVALFVFGLGLSATGVSVVVSAVGLLGTAIALPWWLRRCASGLYSALLPVVLGLAIGTGLLGIAWIVDWPPIRIAVLAASTVLTGIGLLALSAARDT